MKKLLRGKKILLFLVWICFLLMGCGRDIEDLTFVIGDGLDVTNESEIEKELDQLGGDTDKKNIVTLINQIVLPKLIAKAETPPTQKPYKNIESTGDSIHQITRENSLKGKPIFSPHKKIIIIGEKLARKLSLEKSLNLSIRDNEIRRSVAIFIAKGRVKDVLELPNSIEIPVNTIMEIAKNQSRTNRILPMQSIGQIGEKMTKDSSFLLQNVASKDDEIKFVGASIIKGKTKKPIGFLSEEEVEGWNWLTGKGEGGLVKINRDISNLAIYEIKSMDSQITPHVRGDKISFDVKITSKGRLSENWSNEENSFENRQLKELEQRAEREVEKLTKRTLDRLQNNYKADVVTFGEQVKIHYPDVWLKLKDHWDEEFSRSSVKISVDLNIEDYGSKAKKSW